MTAHCIEENGLWACKRTGAKINVTVWHRDVLNSYTGVLQEKAVPIGHMWCPACQKKPDKDKSPVYAYQIQTVAM